MMRVEISGPPEFPALASMQFVFMLTRVKGRLAYLEALGPTPEASAKAARNRSDWLSKYDPDVYQMPDFSPRVESFWIPFSNDLLKYAYWLKLGDVLTGMECGEDGVMTRVPGSELSIKGLT